MTPIDALKDLVIAVESESHERVMQATQAARECLKTEWVVAAKKEMDTWHRLDLGYRFKYRADRLKRARELGYLYISQAIITEYHKLKSSTLAGEVLGITGEAVRAFLKSANEPVNRRGGGHGPKLSPAAVKEAMSAMESEKPHHLDVWCRQYTLRQGLKCSYRHLAYCIREHQKAAA